MTLNQLLCLLIVKRHQPLNQTELSERTGITISAISRFVDVMSEEGRRDGKGGALGLVRTIKHPGNGREKLVVLTEKGEKVLHLVDECF